MAKPSDLLENFFKNNKNIEYKFSELREATRLTKGILVRAIRQLILRDIVTTRYDKDVNRTFYKYKL